MGHSNATLHSCIETQECVRQRFTEKGGATQDLKTVGGKVLRGDGGGLIPNKSAVPRIVFPGQRTAVSFGPAGLEILFPNGVLAC